MLAGAEAEPIARFRDCPKHLWTGEGHSSYGQWLPTGTRIGVAGGENLGPFFWTSAPGWYQLPPLPAHLQKMPTSA